VCSVPSVTVYSVGSVAVYSVGSVTYHIELSIPRTETKEWKSIPAGNSMNENWGLGTGKLEPRI